MNKAIKFGLIIVGALAALFVTAAIILVLTVDPNDYKVEMAQMVKEETGRDLRFDGDIRFNFFPWLGLEVGPMALGNAPGFSPDKMVSINKAEASIRIIPLLSGEIAIGMIVLDGFTLNLTKNAKGVTNWDDLTKAKDQKPEKTKSEDQTKDTDQKELKALSVQGIEITNANVIFADQQAGQQTTLTNLNLEVGEVGEKVRFPFKLSFDLKLDKPKISTRPELAGFAQFDLDAGTFEISEMALNALGMKIIGLFFAKSTNDAFDFSGELTLNETSLRKLMTEIDQKAPVTTDPSVLERFSADIKYNGTGNSASLEKMTIKLDDTTIEGTGSVTDFDKPAIAFAVNVDAIDVDRYMPPAAQKSKTETTTVQTKEDTAPATEPDLSALRTLNLTGKLTIGKVKAMNLNISQILCEVRARNGILTTKPFSAHLYDGTLNAQSVLDANPKLATWTEKANLKGVQAGPLLKDLTGKDHLLGTTVVKYDMKGFGLTPDNIKKSLTGTASFAFTDGAINGVNVAKMLRDAFNTIKGKSASPDEPQKTDFAELLGSAVIKNGHITNNDLFMKSPLLRITGKGWANLPKNSVDYTAIVTLVGTLKGQDGSSLEELSGLPLPIHATGNLDSPEIGLDVKAMAEALLKDTFKQGTKGVEDKLRKSILGNTKSGTTDEKKKPEGLLKGLF
jgi:AsmA protein